MPKIVQLQSPNRPRTTIGQMRHEVTIKTYGDAPFGEYSLERTYVNVATVRARVVNISGSASREGKGIDANITHTVVIRKPEFELTTENMLEWTHPVTNEHLRPRQVRPVGRTSNDPREQYVMILCESMGDVEAFKDPSPETTETELSFFITTWLSPNNGNEPITIPYSGTGYDGVVNWYAPGDDVVPIATKTFNDADMSGLNYFLPLQNTLYTCKISGTFPAIDFSSSTDSPMFKSVENLGRMGWSATGLANGFEGCTVMTKCDFGETDAATTCTTLERTFNDCGSLPTLPDLSMFTSVTSIDRAFRQMLSLTAPPDLSNMALIVDAESCFSGDALLTTIIPMTTINVLTNAVTFLNGCNNLTDETVDNLLNIWAASVQAFAGVPSAIVTDLGDNYYNFAGEAAYNYLTGLGWTITSAGKKPVAEFITTWGTSGSTPKAVAVDATGTGYSGTVEWFAPGDDVNPVQSGTFADGDMGALIYNMPLADTVYTCKIAGTFPRIFFDGGSIYAPYLLSVENLGVIGLAADGLYRGFYGCYNLIKADFGDTDAHLTVDTLHRTFRDCARMTEGPDISLFTLVTNTSDCYYGTAIVNGPDLSNLHALVYGERTFFNCSEMISLTIQTDFPSVDMDFRNYMTGADAMPEDQIDAILTQWAANVLANGGIPANEATNLGDNYRTATATEAYDYLVSVGWIITGGELPPPPAMIMTWMSPNTSNKVITLGQTGTGYEGYIEWFVEGDDINPIAEGAFSDADMSALTVVLEFTDTIYTSKITGTFPRIYMDQQSAILQSVESLGYVNMEPDGLYWAFRGCAAMHTFNIGDSDFAAVCTTLERTWQGAQALVDNIPDISGFVNVTNIVGTFDTSMNITTPPDYSNMAKLTIMDSAFRGMTSLTEIIVPTTIDLVTRSYWFAENSNNIKTTSIDTALNTFAASVLANSGVPSNLIIDLGLNQYSPAGEDAYNYLTGLGWTIQGITLWAPPIPYDLSSLRSDITFDVNLQIASTTYDFYISPDGTKMYIDSYSNEYIYQYTLSTPYDASTLVYDNKSLNMAPQLTQQPRGILFNNAGTRFYVTSDYNRNTYQYNLSTPWDISTAVYNSLFWHFNEDAMPVAIFMNPDETKLYMYGVNADGVYEYDMPDPGEVATMVYSGNWYNQPSGEAENGRSLVFSPDGTKMFMVESGAKVMQYSLSTPWDLSTVVWQENIIPGFASVISFRWNPDGTEAWALSYNGTMTKYIFNELS